MLHDGKQSILPFLEIDFSMIRNTEEFQPKNIFPHAKNTFPQAINGHSFKFV